MPTLHNLEVYRNYLDGEWISPSAGKSIDLVNPATAEVFGVCALANEDDVTRAVNAASGAMSDNTWAEQHPKERLTLLMRIAQALRDMEEEIGRAECIDGGKRLSLARAQAHSAARYFEYYAGLADKLEGTTIPLGGDYLDYTLREPMGVTGHIIPWNFPIQMTARSLAPALAAGCTAVVKSPEIAPASVTYIAKACEEAGVPAGVVNVLCGLGTEAGAALVRNPGVDLVVFTGSVATGQTILRATAETITPAVIELGGKSAGIVCADADSELVVENTIKGIFLNSGQVCSACSRLLVHDSLYTEVTERLQQRAQAISIGPGIEDYDLGPVISKTQQERIAAFCDEAISQGARALCGGKAVDRLPGFFFEPTIIVDADRNCRIAREEVFGPVIVVQRFSEIDEAVEMANGTDYGLVAGVYTRDLSVAHRIARQLLAGQVYVNEWFAGGVETPFGGVKKSGFGREKGQEALLSYVRTKNVAVRL